jgi:sugar phosphate isomerase/epimerase
MPALEAMSGVDLEVPIITTALTSMADPTAGEVLGLAGVIGVPFFRPGPWRFSAPSPALQHEIAGLGAVGRASKSAMGIPNTGEAAGGTVANVSRIVRPLDPRWVGFDFDPSPAAVDGGADAVAAAFAMALPRLKMVTVRDCKKDATACPLGEGVVDWRHFFGLLAGAKFTGPITLQVDYRAQDNLAAIRRDGEFVRKCLGTGYGAG